MLLSQSRYFVTCIAAMTPRQLLVSLAVLYLRRSCSTISPGPLS